MHATWPERLFAFLSIFALSTFAFASETDDRKVIVVEFRSLEAATETIDLGAIPAGQATDWNLRIKNQSNSALTIERVDVSCGCVRVKGGGDILDAKGELEFGLSVAPTSVTDSFRQEVRLVVAEGEKYIRLFIKAKTYGKAKVSPTRLSFSDPNEVGKLNVEIQEQGLEFEKVQFGRGILELVSTTAQDDKNIEVVCRPTSNALHAVEHLRVLLRRTETGEEIATDFMIHSSLAMQWQCIPSQLYWSNDNSRSVVRATIVFSRQYVPKENVIPEIKLVFGDEEKQYDVEDCPLQISRSNERVYLLQGKEDQDLGQAPSKIIVEFPGSVVSIPVMGEY